MTKIKKEIMHVFVLMFLAGLYIICDKLENLVEMLGQLGHKY